MAKVVKKKKKKKVTDSDGVGDGVKKKAAHGNGAQVAPEHKLFTRPEIFSKPKDLQRLFNPIREIEVNAEIVRPRMQTESVEMGAARACCDTIRSASSRK